MTEDQTNSLAAECYRAFEALRIVCIHLDEHVRGEREGDCAHPDMEFMHMSCCPSNCPLLDGHRNRA